MPRTRIEMLAQRCHKDLAAALERLEALQDPAAQVQAAAEILRTFRSGLVAVTAVRDSGIVRLAASGASYAAISAISGLTTGRISQVVHQARSPGTAQPGAKSI